MGWGKQNAPTNKELNILGVLWNRGPCTVREVHEAIDAGSETSYTTTLKYMQLMLEKGLLKRDESARSHVYSAAIPAERGQAQVLDDVAERLFSGSRERLLMCALSGDKMHPEEIARIRKIIDEMER